MKNGCYLRVAYGALQQETIAEGIERLVKGWQTLSGIDKPIKINHFEPYNLPVH